MRKTVYGENVDSTCRACGSADETVAHIVAECQKLAQKEYKQVRHDNVAKVIHWNYARNGDLRSLISGIHTSLRKCLNQKSARFYGISHTDRQGTGAQQT